MKYVITFFIILAGVAIGLSIGLGIFEGFEFLLVMFILFPIIFIFGTIILGKGKKEEKIDEETKKQDRFSRWE